MQYVQLSLPKHLYDELGLQLNQTITLRNSENGCELDTSASTSTPNSSDESSSHYPKPLLTTSENDKISDTESNNPSLEKQGGTFQVIYVNAAADSKHNSSTPDLNLSEQLSSDDEQASNGFDDVSCNTSMLKSPKIANIDGGETTQFPFEKHHAIQGSVVNIESKETTISYPRYCETCLYLYSCHASFELHKMKCGQVQKRKSTVCNVYPKICPICKRYYSSKSTFYKHKKRCDEFFRKRKIGDSLMTVQPMDSPSIGKLNTSGNDVSISNSSHDMDVSTEESDISNIEEKPEKWIPVTTNFRNAQKYFVVKNTLQ